MSEEAEYRLEASFDIPEIVRLAAEAENNGWQVICDSYVKENQQLSDEAVRFEERALAAEAEVQRLSEQLVGYLIPNQMIDS